MNPRSNKFMRYFRYVAAALAIVLSGWLLLGYYGLRSTAEDRAHGWQIYELPSHPVLRMAATLCLGLALPFVAAWLMPPRIDETGGKAPTHRFLWRYAFRLILSFICAFVVAGIIAALTMILLDSGVI